MHGPSSTHRCGHICVVGAVFTREVVCIVEICEFCKMIYGTTGKKFGNNIVKKHMGIQLGKFI